MIINHHHLISLVLFYWQDNINNIIGEIIIDAIINDLRFEIYILWLSAYAKCSYNISQDYFSGFLAFYLGPFVFYIHVQLMMFEVFHFRRSNFYWGVVVWGGGGVPILFYLLWNITMLSDKLVIYVMQEEGFRMIREALARSANAAHAEISGNSSSGQELELG